MTDRPISFSDPMPAAIIAGRKTQTRRILQQQPIAGIRVSPFCSSGVEDGHGRALKIPYGPGDRLWVRESYFQFGRWIDLPGKLTAGGRQKWAFVPDHMDIVFDAPSVYRKAMHRVDPGTSAWHKRLGRFMPRWASRITLTVTEVRVQRLQDISEEDAAAEGVERIDDPRGCAWKSYETYPDGTPHPHAVLPNASPVTSFREIWNSINGASAWEANPWVAAYSFTVALGNIDSLPVAA